MIDIKLLNIDEISKIKNKLKNMQINDLSICKSYYDTILNELHERCVKLRYVDNTINSNSNIDINRNGNSKWNNGSSELSINDKFPLLPNNDSSIPIIPKITKTTNNPYLDGLVSTTNKSKQKKETIEDKIDNAIKQMNEVKNNNSDNNNKKNKKKSKGILLTSY